MSQMKTKIKIDKAYKPEEREAIAYEIIEKIIERTQKGKDKNGNPFPSYSKSYKESLNFKIGGKTSKVDLTLSGDMLADIQLLNHKSGEITIGFEKGTESNAKAEGNIKGTYGQKTSTGKRRDFLGIEKKDLSEIYERYPKNDIETRRDRVNSIKDILGGADEISGRFIIEEIINEED